MSRNFDVYGVGNAIMDLQLQIADEAIAVLGLEKAGMKLVDVAEQKAIIEYFHGQQINQTSGGSAANTMIAIAQLGGQVGYGCRVGDDSFGEAYLAEMAELRVQISSRPVEGSPTGTCVILITPDAERTMNTHLGASASLDEGDVDEAAIKNAQWVYIEGYLFSSESGQRVTRKVVELAKRHSTKIAVTFSDGFIVDFFGESLRHVVSNADLVFANLNEARRFTGLVDSQVPAEKVFEVFKSSAPTAVMTMSEHGALVSDQAGVYKITPVKTQAVDDTGAGDMFAGAFLYGVTHGLSSAESGKLGCLLASRVVSQLGARLAGDLRQFVGVVSDTAKH